MPLRIENNNILFHDDYHKERQRRKYWDLSYTCYGPDYVRGEDGEGVKILRKHEREDDADYQRRLETAVPWSFVGPIIRRYNDFVFRKPFEADNEAFGEYLEDIDGQGTSAAEFFKERLKRAQIEKVNYILLDVINGDKSIQTKAQAQAAGVRYVLRGIKADQVIHWKWWQGVLIEAAILMKDKDDRDFVWYVTEDFTQKIYVEIRENLLSIVEDQGPILHTWGGCALVPVIPDFGGQSQAAPLAELQKAVTRERSLLDEELQDATFTINYATGVSKENVDNDGNMKFGPKQWLWLPDSASSVGNIGADVNQAASIRQSIADNTKEIYRQSGVSSDAEGQQVESGVAKAFRFNDLAANLSALAFSVQKAHRRCEDLLANAAGITDYSYVVYSQDFTMPILQQELSETITGLRSGLPQVLINKLIDRFAARNFDLSDEEKVQLENEITSLGVLPNLLNNQAARMGG